VGRPRTAADGYFTKRTAEEWLRAVLDEARRGTLPGMVRTGATFADAAAEWLRYCEVDRGCKPSTLVDYRSNVRAHLLPAFAGRRLEEITPVEIDRWRGSLSGLAPRSRNKLLVVMHGIFKRAIKVWGLPANPVDGVEKQRQRSTGDLEVFSPEEVMSLVRAAASEQDGAVYLTAAFTGLRRGELLALRWRDVDFAGSLIRVRASFAGGQLTSLKSGKVRSVPMAPEIARVLAELGARERGTGDDDLVFVGEYGFYLDGSALRRRYAAALRRAGLRPLRFHDLRHLADARVMCPV
jgi:integrase